MADINYPNKQVAVNPLFPAANEKWTAANANEVKAAVNSKQDKEAGKGLSANDFTNALKGKLEGIDPSGNTVHELWLEDLRIEGDTDTVLLKRGISEMQSQKTPLRIGSREYSITDFIPVDGDYFAIIGTKSDLQSGTRFKNDTPNYGRITAPVDSLLTYPTKTDPAPMKGCCFYFTSLIYYPLIEDVTFNNFRFACAYLEAHNSPTFSRVTYYYCNAATIAYQGCQNNSYINCGASDINTLHISSATCFPAGSPYAGGDNYYSDSLSIKNEAGYNSFGNVHINVDFDKFVRESFLRPNVNSVTIAQNLKYLDNEGNVYPDDSPYCNPSGWLAFVPMRNPRLIFGHKYKNIDIRVVVDRGIALLNESVVDLNIEGQFSLEVTTIPEYMFMLGSVYSAFNLSGKRPYGTPEREEFMFGFTGRSQSGGFTESSQKYITDINLLARRPYITDFYYQLFFDSDKQLKPYNLTEEVVLELQDPTFPRHVMGVKIGVTLIPGEGGKISFLPGQFAILTTDPIDYTKNIYIEFEYSKPRILVKIYSVLTSEEWIAQS